MDDLRHRLLKQSAFHPLTDADPATVRDYYQSVLDSVGSVVYTVDRELRITGVNQQWDAFARMNGGEHLIGARVVGAFLLDQMSGHALERWRTVCQQILSGELDRYLDEIDAPESSAWQNFSLAATPLCNSQGEITGITFVATNITQLKKAEHEMLKRLVEVRGLRQVAYTAGAWSERRKLFKQVTADIANLLDADKCVIFLWDENTGHLQAQEPAHGLAGRKLADLSLDMGHPADPDALWTDLEERDYILLNEGDAAPSDVAATSARIDRLAALLAVLRVSGRIHGALLVAGRPRPFGVQDGQLLAHLAVPIALSIENAELNRRLLDRNQQLATVRDDLDHLIKIKDAIRMPLSVVRGYLELLADGVMGPVSEGQSGALQTVLDKTHAIINLINRFTPRRFPRDAARYEPVSLANLLRQIVEQWQPVADQAGVGLAVQLPDPQFQDGVTAGDPEMLYRVFGTLVGRAIQVRRGRGSVQVSLQRLGGIIHIQVADRGGAVPADPLPRHPEPAIGVPMAEGISLAEIKRIVEGHGGQVWAENTPDFDNVFHVALRRAED